MSSKRSSIPNKRRSNESSDGFNKETSPPLKRARISKEKTAASVDGKASRNSSLSSVNISNSNSPASTSKLHLRRKNSNNSNKNTISNTQDTNGSSSFNVNTNTHFHNTLDIPMYPSNLRRQNSKTKSNINNNNNNNNDITTMGSTSPRYYNNNNTNNTNNNSQNNSSNIKSGIFESPMSVASQQSTKSMGLGMNLKSRDSRHNGNINSNVNAPASSARPANGINNGSNNFNSNNGGGCSSGGGYFNGCSNVSGGNGNGNGNSYGRRGFYRIMKTRNRGNKLICKPKLQDFYEITNCNCKYFAKWHLNSNCQSLKNVLLSQHNLLFNNKKCCQCKNGNESNDNDNSNDNCNNNGNGNGNGNGNDSSDLFICLKCVYWVCQKHVTLHATQMKQESKEKNNNDRHYLYFDTRSQQIYCCKCGMYHNSQWTDKQLIYFLKLAQNRVINGDSTFFIGNNNTIGSGDSSSSNTSGSSSSSSSSSGDNETDIDISKNTPKIKKKKKRKLLTNRSRARRRKALKKLTEMKNINDNSNDNNDNNSNNNNDKTNDSLIKDCGMISNIVIDESIPIQIIDINSHLDYDSDIGNNSSSSCSNSSNGTMNNNSKKKSRSISSKKSNNTSKCKSRIKKNKKESKRIEIFSRFDPIIDTGTLGLRGMLNSGNTCFMAVILQALIHNRFVRNYFLSDLHKAMHYHNDKNDNNDGVDGHNHDRKSCVACEIDELYSDMYCGVSKYPASICSLMTCLWRRSEYKGLASYDMHDSHEFQIELLNILCADMQTHKMEIGSRSTSPNKHNNTSNKNDNNTSTNDTTNDNNNSKDKNDNNENNDSSGHGGCQGCIVHRVFGGQFRNHIICHNPKCQSERFKNEQFLGISLDIVKDQKSSIYRSSVIHNDNNKHFEAQSQSQMEITCNTDTIDTNKRKKKHDTPPRAKSNELTMTNHKHNNISSNSNAIEFCENLNECLEMYTHTQPIPDYYCPKCNQVSCTKQVSILSLPKVIILHLKRYHNRHHQQHLTALSLAIANAANEINGSGGGGGGGGRTGNNKSRTRPQSRTPINQTKTNKTKSKTTTGKGKSKSKTSKSKTNKNKNSKSTSKAKNGKKNQSKTKSRIDLSPPLTEAPAPASASIDGSITDDLKSVSVSSAVSLLTNNTNNTNGGSRNSRRNRDSSFGTIARLIRDYKVDFPVSDYLDLTSFMSMKDNSNNNNDNNNNNNINMPQYRLMGVIVHVSSNTNNYSINGIGSRDGNHGHYRCYVRGSCESYQEWYQLDDEKIILVTQEQVKSQAAYLLLYEQVFD